MRLNARPQTHEEKARRQLPHTPARTAAGAAPCPARMSDSEAPSLPLFTPRSWAVAGAPLTGAGSLPPVPQKDVTAGLDLFQAAPAAETEATTDGYTAWKTAMAAEKAAEQARQRSAELPMQTDADGFTRWRQEAEEARRAFEKRWGIPPGKMVRVLLRGESREREGLLRLAEEPPEKAGAASFKDLRLVLGGHTFSAAQIVSLVRV